MPNSGHMSKSEGLLHSIPGLAAGAIGSLFAARELNARRSAERFAAAAFETLLDAIDANDHETGAHVRRVAAYSLILARAADLDGPMMRSVERIALFHDIGKIHSAIYDVIHEDTKLTPSEWKLVATHPQRGAEVLQPLSGFYPDLGEGVLCHHESWNGCGYPRGLKGTEIPLQARIVSIADTYDAITHTRRYRTGRGAMAAAEIILSARGTQFDPDLVDLFLFPPVFDEIILALRELHKTDSFGSEDRRHGDMEHDVPEITFRWRRPSASRRPQGPNLQRSPGSRPRQPRQPRKSRARSQE